MQLNRLLPCLLLAGSIVVLVTTPAGSEELSTGEAHPNTASGDTSAFSTQQASLGTLAPPVRPITEIQRLSEIERPLRSAQMLVQSSPTPADAPDKEFVQVTSVKANPTAKGVELILQTPKGSQLQVVNSTSGNNFIADIPNAQLRLPSGEAFTFRSDKPIAGITQITVTNLDANTIRVTVTGESGLPVVELLNRPQSGLIFSVASESASTQQEQQPQTQEPEQVKPGSETQPQKPSVSAEEEPSIELVVTAERPSGYRVPDGSTATKTDTPLRDIPQSIQVIPQEVLRDQQTTRVNEALRNTPGVTPGGSSNNRSFAFTVRGFSATSLSGNVLRNGLPDPLGSYSIEVSNVERIDFLKGPASVLFGRSSPGGTINVITKQPLRDPFYAIEATVGNYDFYRGAVDLSGPLNDSKTVLYRLNASYQDRNGFVDFFKSRVFLIAPVLRLEISKKTNLTLEADYTDTKNQIPLGIPAVGTVLPNPNGEIPRNRYTGERDNNIETRTSRVGYRLEHKFSDNWSFRNAFQAAFVRDRYERLALNTSLASDNRTLNRTARFNSEQYYNAYNFTADLIGKFSTGSIQHQLLFGVDLSRLDTLESSQDFGTAPSLDLFNPVYGKPLGRATPGFSTPSSTDALGVYVQDQVTLASNLKLLLGLRFDTFKQTNEDKIANTETRQSGDAFSPRVGLVYQPIPPISLYASYNRSFTPAIGNSFSRSQFQPERGTQYEVGVKADISNRLSATLAFYDLTRSNVLTNDPAPGRIGFSIQIGKQRSRGIELNLAGEILPGWNIYAGYAYTDALIKAGNPSEVGKRLDNAPENAFNLWTTYQIQKGALQGLGFGVGFFFIGDRQGDLANTFELPSYFTTDAAIFYKRRQFRAQVNFRNLFNVDYFESALNRARVFPGAPFTVQGTISWQF